MGVPAHTKVESLEDRVTRLEKIIALMVALIEQNRRISYPHEVELVRLAGQIQDLRIKTPT